MQSTYWLNFLAQHNKNLPIGGLYGDSFCNRLLHEVADSFIYYQTERRFTFSDKSCLIITATGCYNFPPPARKGN